MSKEYKHYDKPDRLALARAECEKDGFDPNAEYVQDGELTGLTNADIYDLVLGGHYPRPTKPGLTH